MKKFINVAGRWRDRAFMLALSLVLAVAIVPMVGCTAAQQQADIAKILKLIPVVSGITNAAGNIVAAADPALAVPIKASLVLVDGGFTVVGNILTTYQTNINGMPLTVVNQLDAAVASINTNLNAIETQYPQLSAAVVAALEASLASLQVILTLLASVIPAPAAAVAFPKTYAALSARGIKFGVRVAVIPTKRAYVQDYDAKLKKAGFGKYRLHVPWVHVGPVPVLP